MTDRRIGVNKFGSGVLFGPSDSTDTLAWSLEVDWDQDGAFDGTNEASRMIGFDMFRGRRNYLRPRGQGFEPIQTGSLTVELDNHDGRYDGWNTSSPLYPNVTYGADVRFRVRDMSSTDTTPYSVFYGVITDIKTSGYGHDAKVTLYVKDGWYYLRDYTARVALTENIAPDVAHGLVLDYIGWPTRWGRDLATNGDNIKFFWASGNKQAGTVIEDVSNSFVGFFFIAADGKATYIPRSVATSSVFDYDQATIEKDIGLPQPFEARRNITRIKSYPRTQAATDIVWQLLGDTPSVQSGTDNEEIIWANYTRSDLAVPVKDPITPISSTDYTTNTQADGLGVDKTTQTVVIMEDFGDTAKLTVINISGGDFFITKLQIRGDAVFLQNNADITYPADIATVTQPRELFLDLEWQQDLNVAKDFSNLIGPFMDALNPFPTIKINNRPAAQYTPDLFQIVTTSIPKLGIFGDAFRVGGIRHRSRGRNCQKVETTLSLESYISFTNFWTWPIIDFGTDTIFGA